MKKLILSLTALVLMASGLHAGATTYLHGPGFADGSGSNNPGLQVGTVPQTSSTCNTGNFLASAGTDASNYISVSRPATVFHSANGNLYMWINYVSNGNTESFVIATKSDASSYFWLLKGSSEFIIQADNGVIYAAPLATGCHLVNVTWNPVTTTVKIDTTVVVSNGSPLSNFAPDFIQIGALTINGNPMPDSSIDYIQFSSAAGDAFLGPGVPTPTPTFSFSPTVTKTSTITKTPSPTATPTGTRTSTITPSRTTSPTPTKTWSFTQTITTTPSHTPTLSPTPTAASGTLSFDYSVPGQVYCTWPGTNINTGNGSQVYVAYGPRTGTTYPYSAGGGYDPVHDVKFATVPRSWPFYARGRIINPQGSFSTIEGFAYGPFTLTPSPTISATLTPSPTPLATATKVSTKTPTPVPVFTNVATDTSTPGQVYISWQASNINVSPTLDVYVKYGSTTSYGKIAEGGYDVDSATFFATVPQGGPFHFKCAIQNRQGINLSSDFTVP